MNPDLEHARALLVAPRPFRFQAVQAARVGAGQVEHEAIPFARTEHFRKYNIEPVAAALPFSGSSDGTGCAEMHSRAQIRRLVGGQEQIDQQSVAASNY